MARRAVKPKSGKSARCVFISYARKDGADTAQRLSKTLESAGHDVWLDTSRIRGGASWTREIEEALNRCDVQIAVLTPASYVSEICRAEQIWALDEGKIVIPVMAVAGAPVPLYLKSRNYRKYPEQQADLLADIAGHDSTAAAPAVRPLRYDTVPNLPQNHIVREGALDELRELVFTEGAGTNSAVTAIAGMGGIGKTVLATALCRNPVVQRAFPDGIAWIKTGREWDGDFVIRMREVARALGDDLSGYDNKLSCENSYRTSLREKAALVVVDDVWNLEHLRPLLVDAPRSRFLFTTRDAGIAKAVTDRKYPAGLLSRTEARKLLASWAGKSEDKLPPEAEQIIEECGELPSAIAQIGAILRDLSLPEWRDTLRALESADISGIEDRLPNGQESFFKSLAVSFQALPAQMQERYLRLAVLLEDVPAAATILETLWIVNEAETRRTARYFVDRSLASWEDPDDPERGITLHDLQLDYVRALFKDQKALRLIHGAVRLSANVISWKPQEFASQITGRLVAHEGIAAIAEFTRSVAKGAPRPWLRPLWPSLHPPGTALIRTMSGHSFIEGVAVSADGKRAVSASGDHTLKIWDLESGEEIRTLKGHSDGVNAVAMTPDGKRAVSASDDNSLKVWDVDSGLELRTLTAHTDNIHGVSMTPDGRRAVSASWDKTLKLWDLEIGVELGTLTGHTAGLLGVAVTPDGRRAVSASRDNTLKVWDLESGLELRTLAAHTDAVQAVAVTPDGRRVVSGSWDKTLKIWDLDSGRELSTLHGHAGGIRAVAVTADGRRAVSGSDDNTLKVWDLETGNELRTLAGHSSFVMGVALTADGKRAVSGSWDRTLKLWDLQSGLEGQKLMGDAAGIGAIAVTADGRRALSASGDKTIKIWDLDEGREVLTLAGHADAVSSVAVTPDGRRAVSASDDMTLRVWDLDRGQAVQTLTGYTVHIGGVAVTPDGRLAISGGLNKELKVWNLETGQLMFTLTGHSDRVMAVAVTPDGRRAISGSWDKTLRIWDLASGQETGTLKGHADAVFAVAVTADGRRAVSASRDNTLKVWDLKTGQEIRTLNGHSDFVFGIAVTADGQRAVSASSDNTLKVWDLATGAIIASFTCEGEARCCAFAGTDKVLAADEAGRLYFLRLLGLN